MIDEDEELKEQFKKKISSLEKLIELNGQAKKKFTKLDDSVDKLQDLYDLIQDTDELDEYF